MNWICSHCGEKYSELRTRCSLDGQRVVEDLTGEAIGGRYRVRELIGVGGMDSTVWKAWQAGTERSVAIKVLPPADADAAKRFSRGARIAANLSHPNCTIIHDYGQTEDGKLFLVMELLHGQVLQDILGTEGMSQADVLHIADQVLRALEHAHSQRAVHRDLKPDNLYLTRRNEDALHVKILDFGIAKYIEEDPSGPEETGGDGLGEEQVTEQRQVCGTPQYMAPEQVVGGRVDAATDIYSLGVVMYRMLTGRLPFDGKTRYELYQKHLQEAPPSFRTVRPDLELSSRLELIVMKALGKQPAQRFQSAADMRKALADVDLRERRQRTGNHPRVAVKATSPSLGPKKGLTVVLQGEAGATETFDVDQTSALPYAAHTQALPNAAVWAALLDAPDGGEMDVDTMMVPDAPMQSSLRRSAVSLQAAVVPEPAQTEPSSVSHEGAAFAPREAPQRKWLVAAVLLGAFLLGVGGVAGLMAVLRQPKTPAVVAEGPPEVGSAVAAGPAAAGGPAVAALDGAPAVTAGPTPGELAGASLGEVAVPEVPAAAAPEEVPGEAAPAPPELREVEIDSLPRGAHVQIGELDGGVTPTVVALPDGEHDAVIEKAGYATEHITVHVSEGSPATLRHVVSLSLAAPEPRVPRAPLPAPRAVAPAAPPHAPPVAREVVPAAPAAAPLEGRPSPAPTARADAPHKPRVEILGEAKQAPRKPSVELLDEGAAAPKKPEGAAAPKKPKVELLGE